MEIKLAIFFPQNDLENSIVQADSGSISIENLLEIITRSPLFISSKTEVEQDGRGFDPLLLEQDGNALVAAFSSLERPDLHSEVASYVLQMSGRDFFLRLPPKYGAVVNPGYAHQLIIAPNAVSDLKRKLSEK
jgi:hypothetical protein